MECVVNVHRIIKGSCCSVIMAQECSGQLGVFPPLFSLAVPYLRALASVVSREQASRSLPHWCALSSASTSV